MVEIVSNNWEIVSELPKTIKYQQCHHKLDQLKEPDTIYNTIKKRVIKLQKDAKKEKEITQQGKTLMTQHLNFDYD